MGFLKDWRFILIFVGIIAGIAALILWGGKVSPIDRYMKSKGGGITAMFSGDSGANFGEAPKDSYELVGSEGATHFIYVKPEHITNRTTMRAIGAAVCKEAKSPTYCEVYIWNTKDDIKVELPVTRGDTLVAFYENKNGKANLKMLQ